MEAGTFRKIIVSFLPVGHTHEDIDQFFSRIAMYLRTRDAHSRLELARIISHLHASSSDWGKVRLVKPLVFQSLGIIPNTVGYYTQHWVLYPTEVIIPNQAYTQPLSIIPNH